MQDGRETAYPFCSRLGYVGEQKERGAGLTVQGSTWAACLPFPSSFALVLQSNSYDWASVPVQLWDGWKFWRSTLKSSKSVQTKFLGGKSRSVCRNTDAWWPCGFLQHRESLLTSAQTNICLTTSVHDIISEPSIQNGLAVVHTHWGAQFLFLRQYNLNRKEKCAGFRLNTVGVR